MDEKAASPKCWLCSKKETDTIITVERDTPNGKKADPHEVRVHYECYIDMKSKELSMDADIKKEIARLDIQIKLVTKQLQANNHEITKALDEMLAMTKQAINTQPLNTQNRTN